MDVLLFRDGRPFTAGEQSFAKSVFPPLPSTVAGSIRTWLGRELFNENYEKLGTANMSHIQFYGPFFANSKGEPLFLWPEDLVPESAREKNDGNRKIFRRVLEKRPDWVYTARPERNAYALILKETVADSELQPIRRIQPFPDHRALFTDRHGLEAWCSGKLVYQFDENGEKNGRMEHVRYEPRPGIQLNPETTVVEEGKFYFVQMQRYADGSGFIVGLENRTLSDHDWQTVVHFIQSHSNNIIHLGGERRLARVHVLKRSFLTDMISQLKPVSCLRILLLTPAVLDTPAGWWSLTDGKEVYKVNVQAVATPKLRHVLTGWDYMKNRPKPPRFCLPAGTVLVCASIENKNLPAFGFLGGVSKDKNDDNDIIHNYPSIGFGLYIGIPQDEPS